MKRKLKSYIAMLLVAIMIFNAAPISAITAYAADDTDYLFIATDRHANTSIIASLINAMEDDIGENKLEYLGLGGDMVGRGNSHPAYNSSTVLAEVTGATSSLSATNVDIVAGIHDMNVNDDAGIVLPYSGGGAEIYEGDKYYVYGVPESCISGEVSGVDPATEANAFVTWANGSDIDKSKVIIVLSHYPLHQRRNDNDGAVYWASALNTVAAGDDTTIDRDVAFFWGHNHTEESSADTSVYHVAPKGSISVQGGSSNQTIYFTYANAGYLKEKSSATLVEITDSKITFDKYVGSSVSTTNSVERVKTVETVTLDSITVSGTNEYSVGAELNLTVTANYSDGSTKDVTEATEFSGYDMGKAGNQTVTATYEGKTTTFDITVNEIQRTVTVTDGQVEISATSLGLTEISIENVTGTPDLSESLVVDDYITYDIELTNYKEGEEVKYVISLPDGMTTSGRSLYAVASDGTLTELAYEAGTDEDGFATVTFTTTYTGMFAFGEKKVTIPTDAKLTKLEITSKPDNTKYFVATEADADDVVVNISGLIVEATYSDGTDTVTKEIEWDRFGEIADGYSLSINPKVIGPQTVTVSYTYGDITLTDIFDITICYKTYTDATNVQLDFTTADVTEVTVEENTDAEFVVNAMKGYATNYVSYDINLTGYVKGEKVTVTLPVPEGVENPAAYYISDNGNVIENMNATDNGDVTISFETDHFSTYVVSDDITTESRNAETYSTEGTDVTDAIALAGQTVTLNSTLYSTPEGGTATDITESSGLTPTYEVVTTKGNPNVITSISGNVATLSGTAGTAVVKVSYTSGDLTVWDEFIVTATAISDDLYTITMHKQTTDQDGNPTAGDEITAPITIKNIQNGMQDSVWAVVKADGIDLGSLGDELTWNMTGDSIGTIDSETGVITFDGTEGTATVTAYYTCPGGRVIQASVTYSVTIGNYTVPEDGTDDFPEYPDPGAIRFDKHATAVGNFSETGIAQVELSMTGVPYGTEKAIDVVVMLDMTGSMSANGMAAAVAAAKAFVKKIVQNDDGTYNKNRVAVYQFNSNGVSTYFDLQMISSDSELETAQGKIVASQESGGTPFDTAASHCQTVLSNAKTNLPSGETTYDRGQFCVFMSDGGPTTYKGSDGYTYYAGNASGDRKITNYIGGYTSSTASSWTYSLPTEYYTDAMKADGVTVYTVGLLLQNKPSRPSPYSSMTNSTYDSTTDSLTTIGSHYYFTSTILKNMATDTNKYIDIFSVDNASKATTAFENIAQSILDAATDVTVSDKIASAYTMVFDAPNTDVNKALPDGQEMYIEVKDYVLTPVYGSDGTTIVDYTRGTAASLMKLYLGKSGTTYYAASNASGTAYATPTFNQTAIGTMYYWTTSQTTSGVSVTVGETTYYFDETGISSKDEDYVAAKWYNMASGAYASGNITTTDIIDDATGETKGTNSICNNLIIATPYFVYNASTKMLTWTATKLSTSELTLSYFLYLDKSGGYSGAKSETPAGTYKTNEYAYLGYTNFQGTECQQTFPVPQMTWNGAQVSYVFYLVNDQGQPVNRAGKVVPFSEAVYVTDVYTHAVTWNDDSSEGTGSLVADYLAKDIVPEVYSLYDTSAEYDIHVYETTNTDTNGHSNTYFIINGSEATGATSSTTKVYNTKAGTKYSAYGTYYASNTSMKDFDFYNTTVAFAVTWKPGLIGDTVVVDYGLDVVIDVIKNDNMAAGVVGVRTAAPIGVTAEGTYDRVEKDTLTSVDLYIDANNDTDNLKKLKIGTATVENLTSVRFSLDKTNGMQFTDPAKFYYEADVNYYTYDSSNNATLNTTSMYSSVTVIPATTVYYEDDFVDYAIYKKENNAWTKDETKTWQTDGTTISATQDQDRPGESQISALLDADNNYGYDSAYTECSKYSLGSVRYVTADASTYGTATFTFYGTGFDIVSLTSNNTGTITVKVYSGAEAKGTVVKNKAVDTYYGYTQDKDGNWIVDNDAENALYQVPVITVEGLTYGQYTVVVKCAYNTALDHQSDGSYNFYMDAVRIYDPTGVVSGATTNTTVSNAYLADKEGWPQYIELRDNIIEASNDEVTENEDGTVTVTGNALSGAIFIDGNAENTSISDYVNYGPNNELYLGSKQSVAFKLDQTYASIIADVQIAIKVGAGDSVSYKIYDSTKSNVADVSAQSIKTATDLYYSIKDLSTGTIVITNSGDSGILSITNIKITYTQNPYGTSNSGDESGIMLTSLYMDSASATSTLMSLRNALVLDTETGDTDINEDNTTDSESKDNESDNTVEDSEDIESGDNDSEDSDDDTNIDIPSEDNNKPVVKPSTPDNNKKPIVDKEETETDKGEDDKNETESDKDTSSDTTETKKVFKPKTFKVKLKKSKVTVSSKYKVIVTTSKTVKSLKVNGKKYTKYKYNRKKGIKTWTITLKARKIGKHKIKVVAYDKNNIASKKIVKTVKVVAKKTSSKKSSSKTKK